MCDCRDGEGEDLVNNFYSKMMILFIAGQHRGGERERERELTNTITCQDSSG